MKKKNIFIRYFVLLVMIATFVACVSTSRYEDTGMGISLPPIGFYGPPDVVVMPDTDDVYFVPDIDVDMFFWNGWWWRPWEGRWYRSQYYDRGWAYYNNVPSFYYDVDPGWRGYYRDRNWYGHRWDYDRIPHPRLQQDWESWHNNRYWERQRTWGVQGYQPRPQQQREELRHQRQEQYHQRFEGQRDQQQRLEQQKTRATETGATETGASRNLSNRRLEQQKLEQQKFEQQRLEQQRLEQQKLEQRKLEQQRLEQQKLEQQKFKQQRLEQQRLEQQKLDQQKLEQEKFEQQKLEQQRLEQQKTGAFSTSGPATPGGGITKSTVSRKT